MSADREFRDRALETLLREHSAETPPSHVDAAILAAAHRAVHPAPHDERANARQAWRWWMPLAAAAAIGVVVIGVLPLAPTALDDTSPMVSDSPVASPRDDIARRSETRSQASAGELQPTVPAPATPSPDTGSSIPQSSDAARSPAREARQKSEAPRVAAKRESADPATRAAPSVESANAVTRPAPSEERANAVATPAPTAESPNAVARPAVKAEGADTRPLARPMQKQSASPSSLEARSSAASRADSASGQDSNPGQDSLTGQSSASGQISAPGRARVYEDGDSAQRNAAEWIARIRALRQDGRLPEAIQELARFRKAFDDADARLPEDLRAWVNSLH